MKKVQYRHAGSGIVRVLRAKDLDRHGIEHKLEDGEDMVWNEANGFSVVMSNRASDSLVELLPDEFEAVDEDADDIEVTPQATDANAIPALQDLPNGSEESGDADAKSSTAKRPKNS